MSDTFNHSKVMLLGLYKCPVSNLNVNPNECILHHLRNSFGIPAHSSFMDWYLWVKNLSDNDADIIYHKHVVCYNQHMKCFECMVKHSEAIKNKGDSHE